MVLACHPCRRGLLCLRVTLMSGDMIFNALMHRHTPACESFRNHAQCVLLQKTDRVAAGWNGETSEKHSYMCFRAGSVC
jgi:hypothetical protein